MANGDIYCLKMFQTLYLQNVLNVFFYQQDGIGTPEDAEGLFEAFDVEVLSNFVGCVADQLDVIRLEVFRPEVPSDFFDDAPVNNQGLRSPPAGQRSPSWAAFGFRSNRAGPGTRASFKRFAGLLEGDMDANALGSSFTTLTAVVDLQAAIGANIDNGTGGAQYRPIQVEHPALLDVPTVKNFDIQSWGTTFLTSQVSRKPAAA